MKKIAVIQTAFLGDLLLAIPLFKQLKGLHPESEITLICRKNLGDVFLQLKVCDKLIEVDKTDNAQFQKDIEPALLRDFDLLLCPHQSFRSNILAKKMKAKLKIGFLNFWNFLVFQKRIAYNKKLPDALRQLSLLGPSNPEVEKQIQNYISRDATQKYVIPDSQSMGLKRRILAHSQTQRVNQKFRLVPGSIFIAPGSQWNTKRWTQEGFREVAQKLSQDHPIVMVGTQAERDLCAHISQGLNNITNIAGQTSLFELMVLLTYGKTLICNDSGAMHLGSLAEISTVAIFGPTVLEQGYEPWNNYSTVIENKNLDCRPCGKHGHEKCPIGTHICMKSIGADEVLNAVKKKI